MKTKEQDKKLKEKTTIGKKVRFYDKINRNKYWHGKVIDEISVISHDYKHFIQKIKWDDNGEIGFRICYYTITKNGKNLVFGQYASQIPQKKFDELLKKCKEKANFL